MVTTHNLGFPRIGLRRELKFALESYWKNQSDAGALHETAAQLRHENWAWQAALDWVPVGDFALYDQVLDMSFTLGHLPERARNYAGSELDNTFRVARGRSSPAAPGPDIFAGEMTKWFDTNYHYIVPEWTQDAAFSLNASRLVTQFAEATAQGRHAKPVIIGPVTYLSLGKSKDGSDPLALLPRLLPVYAELLQTLVDQGATWIQIDEPILVTDLTAETANALQTAYHFLKKVPASLLLTTYFGPLGDNLALAAQLPVAGIHLDAVRGREDVAALHAAWPMDRVLSLGVVDGRNIWKTDLDAVLAWLTPIAQARAASLWIAPSCSLLHVPISLAAETLLDAEIQSWLAFGLEKLQEIALLARALSEGTAAVATELAAQRAALATRRASTRVHHPRVQALLQETAELTGQRASAYPLRAEKQAQSLRLPAFPTTTIGSFPQTAEIRQIRHRFKRGQIDLDTYHAELRREIAECVRIQEEVGIDVLVHGEAERNDMVEYFGEQLDGYVFSEQGWVQSYGSRCVKPPILFGDVYRARPMTVEWIAYAQSLTQKPMKGMLTGPVTLLNWSFVRDDQPRSLTCRQLALAIRQEVLDLEAAGIRVIQIDEPAFREGLPLRQRDWAAYLDWAVRYFRLSADGVRDETQIHTHMCYSEFNDIIDSIAALDADVITIETARSDMELLDAFEHFAYPNEIGPGVYDIHSPRIPSAQRMANLMRRAAQQIPHDRLWVNPDCGLKTRQWAEVTPSLTQMVIAAQSLRQEFGTHRET